jgi:hypothetical protein
VNKNEADGKQMNFARVYFEVKKIKNSSRCEYFGAN